jgi:hypothetical protein
MAAQEIATLMKTAPSGRDREDLQRSDNIHGPSFVLDALKGLHNNMAPAKAFVELCSYEVAGHFRLLPYKRSRETTLLTI